MFYPKLLSPIALAIIAFITAPGCEPQPQPLGPIDGEVVSRISLADSLGSESVWVTGVTFDAATGDRFVFDASTGIHQIDDEGEATLVLAIQDFPEPDVPLRSGFMDIAAMGDGVFALIAVGDGYKLDIGANTLEQWFCYEPGWMDPEQFEQTSQNLGYDPVSDEIISAPLTLDMDAGDDVTRADVATFDGAGAGDLQWYPLDVNIDFGGLALRGQEQVLLGAGDQLYGYQMGESSLLEMGSLAEHGIDMVMGMVIDPETGFLHIVDGADGELVVLQL